MQSGLVVLDVGTPGAIRVTARLQPELDFPDAKPDRSKRTSHTKRNLTR
jgi:hypothetical protein